MLMTEHKKKKHFFHGRFFGFAFVALTHQYNIHLPVWVFTVTVLSLLLLWLNINLNVISTKIRGIKKKKDLLLYCQITFTNDVMLFNSIVIAACLWHHCLIFDPWRKSTFVETLRRDTNSFSLISVRNWGRRWRVQGSAQTDPCLLREPLRAPPLDHPCLQTS